MRIYIVYLKAFKSYKIQLKVFNKILMKVKIKMKIIIILKCFNNKLMQFNKNLI